MGINYAALGIKRRVWNALETTSQSYAEIGREIGISRERVRQIAVEGGYKFTPIKLVLKARVLGKSLRDYPTRSDAPSEYQAYANAIQRCNNPHNPMYQWYGARGIQFKFKSFRQFWKELGPKPSPDLTLERKENNGHYEPGNVKWATYKEQATNRRKLDKSLCLPQLMV